jgi:hypothetical protein
MIPDHLRRARSWMLDVGFWMLVCATVCAKYQIYHMTCYMCAKYQIYHWNMRVLPMYSRQPPIQVRMYPSSDSYRDI